MPITHDVLGSGNHERQEPIKELGLDHDDGLIFVNDDVGVLKELAEVLVPKELQKKESQLSVSLS